MTGRLATEIMDLHSLHELIILVEGDISHYLSLKEEYSDRLGDFLRESAEKYGNEDWHKRLSLGDKLPKEKTKSKEKGKGGKKGKKKKKGEKEDTHEDWVPFQSMSLSTSVQGEAEMMFEVIEAITKKIERLKQAKTSAEELSNVGLGDDIIYKVLIRQGIPEKIVIKPMSDDVVQRFTFSRGFTVVRLVQ